MPRFVERLLAPFDERLDLSNRFREAASTRTVPSKARRFWYCFGGLAFFSAILQALSGMFLSFYYQPTPEKAYASVFYISNYVNYGWLIRSVHVWGARIMIALVVIHMFRVYVTASYKHPREFNWVAGVLLLTVTLFFAITGNLLPWDQAGYWSSESLLALLAEIPVVGEFIVRMVFGGEALSAAALTRFYAGHIMLLPAVLSVLLIAHFWMVRKQGISEPL